MILLKKINDLKTVLDRATIEGKDVSFVPTMGALHEGHLSLLKAAAGASRIVVVSIFVNPSQFNDPADFEKYPVTIEKDITMLESGGCDVLFLPAVDEIYPRNRPEAVAFDLGFLERTLEGAFRPGHFQGVCQVMDRLLSIVQPQMLFMGQKDYQQCMVVNRLIEIRKFDTILYTCPTLRETDGLAMSSRNMRLSEEERKNAVGLSAALSFIKKNLRQGNLSDTISKALDILHDHQFKPDYLTVTDAKTLEQVKDWDGTQMLVALGAAFQGEVRLIDNMVLN
ncbi:MAG: pantoate--beta-alanine ligase [Gemmatimonadaceae bacterium]|nr:pantoate--beta-alanine ligase [Chitinophagaceae bacterium]